MIHKTKKGVIIFPNHRSQEVGKGLEKKLIKQAGLKKQKYEKHKKNKNDR